MKAKTNDKFYIGGYLPGIRMNCFGDLYIRYEVPTSQLRFVPEARFHPVGCNCLGCLIRSLVSPKVRPLDIVNTDG